MLSLTGCLTVDTTPSHQFVGNSTYTISWYVFFNRLSNRGYHTQSSICQPASQGKSRQSPEHNKEANKANLDLAGEASKPNLAAAKPNHHHVGEANKSRSNLRLFCYINFRGRVVINVSPDIEPASLPDWSYSWLRSKLIGFREMAPANESVWLNCIVQWQAVSHFLHALHC